MLQWMKHRNQRPRSIMFMFTLCCTLKYFMKFHKLPRSLGDLSSLGWKPILQSRRVGTVGFSIRCRISVLRKQGNLEPKAAGLVERDNQERSWGVLSSVAKAYEFIWFSEIP